MWPLHNAPITFRKGLRVIVSVPIHDRRSRRGQDKPLDTCGYAAFMTRNVPSTAGRIRSFSSLGSAKETARPHATRPRRLPSPCSNHCPPGGQPRQTQFGHVRMLCNRRFHIGRLGKTAHRAAHPVAVLEQLYCTMLGDEPEMPGDENQVVSHECLLMLAAN